MNNITKGAKLTPQFGLSSVSINGLVVHTLTLRVKKHSLKHMAFWYVSNVETVTPTISCTERSNNTGVLYVTYRYATSDHNEHQNLVKLLLTAQGYVHQHLADLKLGTKTAPDFIHFYSRHINLNGFNDDLPF